MKLGSAGRVPCGGGNSFECQDVLRTESRVHAAEAAIARDEESRDYQKHDGKSYFCDDDCSPELAEHGVRVAPAGSLQRGVEIETPGLDGWRGSKQHGGQDRNPSREAEDPPIEVEAVPSGKLSGIRRARKPNAPMDNAAPSTAAIKAVRLGE